MLKRRIKRITIKNYRSITDLTVDMPDLMVLVGENGSGKSNFVDALRFLKIAMFSIDSAIVIRGGIHSITNRNFYNNDIGIEIVCEIDDTEYIYSFILEKQSHDEYRFKKEFLKRDNEILLHYENNKWHITLNEITLAPPSKTLTLPSLRNYDEISPVYDLLNEIIHSPMNFSYDSRENLQVHKFFQSISNLGSSLYDIENKQPHRKVLLDEYLSALVPFISSVQIIQIYDGVIKIEFIHQNGKRFDLVEESSGTQHILKLLVALLQVNTPSLLAIEEPELFIHPGALAMLCEIIEEASLRQQIIITTHSPDLIAKFDVNAIRVVEMTDDGTKIDVIADSQLEAINEKLFGTGDILRIDGRLKRKEHEA